MASSLDELFLSKLAAGLRAARIEAIVVGNVGSILNGASVLTQDVDLLVRDTVLNRKKLKLFAAALGGAGPGHVSGLTSTERIYGVAVPIDILYDQIIGGLKFASIRSRAALVWVGSETLLVAALGDIIRSKTAANRPKDKAVLPVLKETLAVRRANGLEK